MRLKRILFTLMVMLTCSSYMAVAQENAFTGEGTSDSPYIIDSAEKLAALGTAVNGGETFEGKYFKLTSSIELSGEWTAIGNGTRSGKTYTGNSFKGIFDGEGNDISGLSISSTTGDDTAIGLFGVVDGGTVKNVNLTDVNINVANSDLAGAAIGMMLNGATADNITVSGAIVGNDGVGGIVGRLVIDGTISNCTNNAGVTSSYGGIGGIAGKVYYEDATNTATFASVTKCTNKGIITAPMYVGGIVGLARANVTDCINEGAVVGGTQTGGIIGELIAAGTVSGNENKAKISGKNHLGGIIGDYTQSNAYTYNNVSIANNTNRGVLEATEHCAAIMGCNNIDGFTAMTATGNVSYYYVDGMELFGNPEDMVIDETNKFVATAKIGEVEYFSLQTALDAAVAGTGNITVSILEDIDLTDVAWNPVTVSDPGYPQVTVEGNGKTITGLTDMLFAGTWAGESELIIKNLTIADSDIKHDVNDEKGTIGVGAFIGYPQASATITLENCHLKNSSVEGGHWTGGLIGMAGGYNGNDGPVFMNLTIKDCSVTGSTITGKGSAGGIIGHGSCAAWTNVVIENTAVTDNTILSTGTSTNKAGCIMGTIGAAGQPTTANGETKTGGAYVSAIVANNTVKSNETEITTIYGRQGTETGMLYIVGGSYDNYPIEEGVEYAVPADDCEIVANTDGTYTVMSRMAEFVIDENEGKDFEFECTTGSSIVTTLTYTRTLASDKFNALFVPFTIPEVENISNFEFFQFEEARTAEGNSYFVVSRIQEGNLEANTPYLVRPTGEGGNAKEMELVINDAILYNSTTELTTKTFSADGNEFVIKGTYSKLSGNEYANYYGISVNGQFALIGDGTTEGTGTLGAFRFYLQINGEESAARSLSIRISGESNDATGIVETENGNVKTENCYDLSGRRVQNVQKGIFIVNGKKVVR